MFYTLKRVPRKKAQFKEYIEHDVFLETFFGTDDDGEPKLTDEWDSKNTEYWAGNTDFTKIRGRIKYSNSLEKISNSLRYNRFHNDLEGSYIGIVELYFENGRLKIGEEVSPLYDKNYEPNVWKRLFFAQTSN